MWFRSMVDSANGVPARSTRRTRKRPARRRAARPCLAALEQLEDRVLLSAVPPAAMSEQSLDAVNNLLNIECKLTESQVVFLRAESGVLEHAGYDTHGNIKVSPSPSTLNYFYKIDGELAQIDSDLIGSPTDQGAGGLDGVLLADLKLPAATQKYLQSVLLPAIGQELAMANQLLGQLANQSPQPAATALGGDVDYKSDGYKLHGIPRLTVNFAEIENDLIAADPADMGPALGLQGSPAPGPVGTLLQDLGGLAVDASPPENSGDSESHGTTIAAVEAFLNVENQLIDQQDDLLKLESAFLNGSTVSADTWRAHIHPNFTSPQAAVDYFLKMDADLVQLDNDSVGPPLAAEAASSASSATAPGGIAGVLLTLDLPADLLTTIQNKIVPEMKSDRTALLAMEQQLLQQGGVQPADKTSSGTTKKGGGDKPIEQLTLNFSKASAALIQTDPQGFGPLVPGMLQDLLVTTADEQVSLNFGKIHIHYAAADTAGEQISLNFGKIDFPYEDSGATLAHHRAIGESASGERLR